MVDHLAVCDRAGVRKNVMDLLTALDKKELESVSICFQTKDGGNRTFWNGKDEVVVFMANMLIQEVCNQQELVDSSPYDRLED